MDDYPPAEEWGAFYGQSAAVVAFLVNRGGHEKFVGFIELARADGYDAALARCYGIADVGHFDRAWRRHVQSTEIAADATAAD
jgi:hypothetical protein